MRASCLYLGGRGRTDTGGTSYSPTLSWLTGGYNLRKYYLRPVRSAVENRMMGTKSTLNGGVSRHGVCVRKVCSTTGSYAVVTGGTRGIGAEVALRLAADGIAVTIVSRDEKAASTVASGLPKLQWGGIHR